MSFKLTIALMVLLIAVGVVYYINPFEEVQYRDPPDPWFYQVSVDDMTSIEVIYQGETSSFIKTPSDTWAFAGEQNIPPDYNRWGGMAFLLGGPQTRRDLTETPTLIEDPAIYGLDNPHTTVNIGLTLDRSLQFHLGDKTTDGSNHYGQITGFPQLFLIADAWGDVLSRLVTEPPYPKWYTMTDIDNLAELNIFPEVDNISEREAQISFNREKDGSWTVINLLHGEEKKNVDFEVWSDYLPLMLATKDATVAVAKVPDKDYSPWGIGEKSASIEIRWKTESDRGVIYNYGMSMIIGNKTPDGKSYFVLPDQDNPVNPVLQLPSSWVDTLRGAYDAVVESN